MTQETVNTILNTTLLVAPIVIGGIIAAINNEGLNGTIEKVEPWVRRRQQVAAQRGGWFSKYVTHPILWTVTKFCDWTDGIAHGGLKNGLRVTTTLYAIAVWLMLLYMAFIVVVIVVAIVVVLWIVGMIMSLKDGGESEPATAAETRRAMHDGYSEEKETFSGRRYTEYYGRDGQPIATEEVKERLLGGKHVQCYDKDGNEIGTKELKERFLGGKYVQQYDKDGNEVGTSENKERFLGDKYTEHRDANGNKIGTSEKKETFSGRKVTEHKPE
jgi:hypothetical protein